MPPTPGPYVCIYCPNQCHFDSSLELKSHEDSFHLSADKFPTLPQASFDRPDQNIELPTLDLKNRADPESTDVYGRGESKNLYENRMCNQWDNWRASGPELLL